MVVAVVEVVLLELRAATAAGVVVRTYEAIAPRPLHARVGVRLVLLLVLLLLVVAPGVRRAGV